MKALSLDAVRGLMIAAQGLHDRPQPRATKKAVRSTIRQMHLLQIDTINVIERCHHHILFSRIPAYSREDLHNAQSAAKSVFEYWTHALSFVPTRDFRFFMADMQRHRENPVKWFGSVSPEELRRIVARVRKEGALSIRDIDDDELVEKDHPWASRKPSKRVLQLMFYQGLVAVAAREGMVKTYDLIGRHFGWEKSPRPASEKQVTAYLLDRALRSQGVVSLDSICHLNAPAKKAVRELIEARVKRRQLVPVTIEGAEKLPHWTTREALETVAPAPANRVHILSPFDPLIIQRKRLKLLFGYDHIFEAYVPAAKRQYGYFALPVLVDDRVVAAVDLKTDRQAGKLLVQKWTWLEDADAELKAAIDAELGRFERFQLSS